MSMGIYEVYGTCVDTFSLRADCASQTSESPHLDCSNPLFAHAFLSLSLSASQPEAEIDTRESLKVLEATVATPARNLVSLGHSIEDDDTTAAAAMIITIPCRPADMG